MNFSLQVKAEIADNSIERPCCLTATCYGIVCFSRTFTKELIELYVDNAFIAQWAKTMFARAGIESQIFVRGKKQQQYVFTVNNVYEIEKLLAMISHSGDAASLRLRDENFVCENCFSAFTAAAFLSAGTMADPEKDYGLEFISHRHNMMADFKERLKEAGFAPRLTQRKGTNVLYFRASEQIEDLLTFMGAAQSTMELMNLKIFKELRNTTNRLTNCETANISKTVVASRKTIVAIETLEKHGALSALPKALQQAAVLRVQHPDYSLAELVDVAPSPTSRTRLSQRFKELRQKADELENSPES